MILPVAPTEVFSITQLNQLLSCIYYISIATVCVYVCVLVKEGSLWTSEVALIPWSSCSSVVPQPGGQTRFSEVHIALIESLHAIRLIMDVVCDIFQVLKMRPAGSTKTVPFHSNNPLIKRCMAVQLQESVISVILL